MINHEEIMKNTGLRTGYQWAIIELKYQESDRYKAGSVSKHKSAVDFMTSYNSADQMICKKTLSPMCSTFFV